MFIPLSRRIRVSSFERCRRSTSTSFYQSLTESAGMVRHFHCVLPRTRPLVAVRQRVENSKFIPKRFFSNSPFAEARREQSERSKNFALYLFATALGVLGFSYAAVPLYKVFCQATGYGGTTQQASFEQIAKMTPVEGARPITIKFTSQVSSTLPWQFTPQQRSVKVVPGETALAFYTASNQSEKPIIGVATYNVLPMKAGVYFNKVQCFCFDEQRLKGNEDVDMPVFFFVDPAFLDDPEMEDVRSITLSYTFFQSKTPAPE
eukprot:g4475.t1